MNGKCSVVVVTIFLAQICAGHSAAIAAEFGEVHPVTGKKYRKPPATLKVNMPPELMAALRAQSSGQATARQRAQLFANNDLINRARLNGTINNDVYQAAQKDFAAMNERFGRLAAVDAGAEFRVQTRDPNKPFAPGTDSDYITKVDRVDQIKAMQDSYNRRIDGWLKQHDVTTRPEAPWHNTLDTDFMADPTKVSQAEFDEVARINNDAYRRREAATYEATSRDPSGKPVPQHESTAYNREMEDFQNKKAEKIDHKLNDPNLKTDADLQAELHRAQAQQNKYISRKEDAVDALIKQEGLTPREPNQTAGGKRLVDADGKPIVDENGRTINRTGSKPEGLRDLDTARQGANREPDNRLRTQQGSSLAEQTNMKADMDHANALAESAGKNTTPDKIAATQRDIARISENLPDARKNEVIDRAGEAASKRMRDELIGKGMNPDTANKLASDFGDDFKKGLVQEMRNQHAAGSEDGGRPKGEVDGGNKPTQGPDGKVADGGSQRSATGDAGNKVGDVDGGTRTADAGGSTNRGATRTAATGGDTTSSARSGGGRASGELPVLDPNDPRTAPRIENGQVTATNQSGSASAEENVRREFIVKKDGTVVPGRENPVDSIGRRETVVQVDPVTGKRTFIHGPDVPNTHKRGIEERLTRDLDGRINDAVTSRRNQIQRVEAQTQAERDRVARNEGSNDGRGTADQDGTSSRDAASDGSTKGSGDTTGGRSGDLEGGGRTAGADSNGRAPDTDGSVRTGEAPGTGPNDVEGGARGPDADGAGRIGDVEGARTQDPSGGRGTEVDGSRTTAGDTSGNAGDAQGQKTSSADGGGTSSDGEGGRTGDAEGSRTGTDADASGSRPTDAPGDGSNRVGADAEMSGGRKALNKLGEGMTGVDILNAGQNALDVMDGKKDAGQAAFETADALTGGVMSTGKGLYDKGSDYAGAQGAVSEAQASADASRVIETAQNLADAGVSQEDRLAIMNAMSQGDESLLQNKIEELKSQGVDVTVPDREIVGTESDDTVWERTGDVATGIKDQAVRAGQFAINTGKDLTEIGVGLTEEGVADALIEQQSENLSLDNLSEGAGAIGSMMDDAGTMNERREDDLGLENRLDNALDRDRDKFRSDMTEEEIAAQYHENREQNRPGFQGLLAGSEGTDPATGDKAPVESSVLPGVDLSEHPEIQAIMGQLEGRSQDEIDAVLRLVLADKPESPAAGNSSEGKPGEDSSEGSGAAGEGGEETGNPPGSGEGETPLTDEEKEALRQFLLGLAGNSGDGSSGEDEDDFADEGDFGDGGSDGENRGPGPQQVAEGDFADEGDFVDPTVNDGANPEWRVARIPLPGIDPADFARDHENNNGESGGGYEAGTVYQVIYQCNICLKIHNGGSFADQQAALAASQGFAGQGYRVRIVPRGGTR